MPGRGCSHSESAAGRKVKMDLERLRFLYGQVEHVEIGLAQCIRRLQGSLIISKSEVYNIRAQIVEARRSREDESVAVVFQKYKSAGGIHRQNFLDALLEIRSDLADTTLAANELFDNMDMNEDEMLDLPEFRRAAHFRSSFQQLILQTIPFPELVSSALPYSKEKSQLNVFMDLSELQLAEISQALSLELQSILSENVKRLRTSRDAAQSKLQSGNESSPAQKFSVDTLSAGDITDYHKGLSGRVGKQSS